MGRVGKEWGAKCLMDAKVQFRMTELDGEKETQQSDALNTTR